MNSMEEDGWEKGETIAAFDIGSSNIRYTAGTGDGNLLTSIREEETDAGNLGEQVKRGVKELEKRIGQDIETVSIATTGLIDREKRIIERFDTKAGGNVENIDLGYVLAEKDVFIENDANAAAIGEYYFGSGEEYSHMIRIVMGTGIGGGILEYDKLIKGFKGKSGEIGHIIVDPDGELSQEGIEGSWEAYCSGRTIPEFTHHLHPSLNLESASELFEKAESGNRKAINVLEKINRYNAHAIGSLTNILAPEAIIIGGSVAVNNEEKIIEDLEQRVGKYCYVETPEIRKTDLKNKAEIYGALKIAERRNQWN